MIIETQEELDYLNKLDNYKCRMLAWVRRFHPRHGDLRQSIDEETRDKILVIESKLLESWHQIQHMINDDPLILYKECHNRGSVSSNYIYDQRETSKSYFIKEGMKYNCVWCGEVHEMSHTIP
ncbi:MAG: hypothetical protein UT24_C0015G0028 [Candidatus Woesebacteria bacterium GW2011_GWB1_39_12]|uniref:Uncharacterized protein n=1 Tax=Candidatus Woesebacteria bacterium GW2011_GWB1_39_12 TaxID=1618574 RepID=A0A0G0PPX9_9BACT|nr:MAG: hypothetical protein UT24_C0015G0028 [Candidatus Woesebacteria bacterium GW2011_GWB1_39_12]